MLSISPMDPSPIAQAAVYMAGILTGYTLVTPSEQLQQAWETVRSVWTRRKE